MLFYFVLSIFRVFVIVSQVSEFSAGKKRENNY